MQFITPNFHYPSPRRWAVYFLQSTQVLLYPGSTTITLQRAGHRRVGRQRWMNERQQSVVVYTTEMLKIFVGVLIIVVVVVDINLVVV